MRSSSLIVSAGILFLTGCTLHPRGESDERDRAAREGAAFEKRIGKRKLPDLPPTPSREEALRHAMLANADLEMKYWRWRAAIERIPQEATFNTQPEISFEHMIESGAGSFAERSSVGIGTDPAMSLEWPGKVAGRARVAVQEARAAGRRFDEARFDLQMNVLMKYADWAMVAEQVRIREAKAAALAGLAEAEAARQAAGQAMQADVLRARNMADLARDEAADLRPWVDRRTRELNVLLGRDPRAPLEPPAELPGPRPMPWTDDEILVRAARRNPKLEALAREVKGREDAIDLARQQYYPDFSFRAATDLAGAAQSLMAGIMAPILRQEAIAAGVAEAKAARRAAEAEHRQAKGDVIAHLIYDLVAFRNTERQIALYRDALLPRLQSVVATTQAAYEAGQAPLKELWMARKDLHEVREMLAMVRMEREEHLAEIEAAAAIGALK